jgi:hypothetical protein
MGKVHPQQGNWAVEGVREFNFPNGTWRLAIRESSVVVIVDGEEPEDLPTFVNDVRSVVGGVIDALGFELAQPLRFEPTHAVKDGTTLMFIQPGWPELRDAEVVTTGEWVDEVHLGPLIDATVTSPLLRYAIADSQRAIEMPDDTAFYSYRAIESLRLLFLVGDEDSGSARAESWKDLRAELALTRSELDAIKRFADRRRHGGHFVLTEVDRLQCLLTTRKAIRSAVRRATAGS